MRYINVARDNTELVSYISPDWVINLDHLVGISLHSTTKPKKAQIEPGLLNRARWKTTSKINQINI